MSVRSLRFAASACLILAVAACGKSEEPAEDTGASNLAVTLAPAQLHALPRSVVVEHNGEAVAPSEFSRRQLQPGDRLEIVKIVAGG